MTESEGEAVRDTSPAATKEDIAVLIMLLSALMTATGATKHLSPVSTKAMVRWMEKNVHLARGEMP